ncbi:uncharacterized protein LOC130743763 [Lotus japonicus]|uniref:uncharacterized protein LOC130743763 n=1 Tax=Lotus japonicus TaxID=34305 RepID=UPI00258C554C|nr:uncharacterized protein LOC130743763 [Lotus japonicus]
MSSKYFSILLLLLLVFVLSSHAAKVVEVGKICKLSTNPSFCTALLNSNRGGKDLVSLTQYTIDVTCANLTNTVTLIKSLIAKSAHDPKTNDHYKTCLYYFEIDGGALDTMESTQQSLNKGDYNGVNLGAGAIPNFMDDCILGDDGPDPNLSPFPDTSILPKYLDVIEKVAEVTLILTNLLLGD